METIAFSESSFEFQAAQLKNALRLSHRRIFQDPDYEEDDDDDDDGD